MKIVLIQPPKSMFFSDATSGHWSSSCRPLSLIYLAAAIKRYSKHESEIIDFERPEFNSLESIEDKIKSLKGCVFGVTASTLTRFCAAHVVKVIKETHPDAYIVAGGPHFSNCAEETLSDIKDIDCVLRGESERSLCRLLDILEFKGDLSVLKGLTYRSGNSIVSNPENDIFEDLDSLDIKFPEYVLSYPENLMGVAKEIRAISIMSSRGCPYNCVFCSKSGLKYRHHSVNTTVEEIKFYIDNFGIKCFNFLDLTFTANVDKAREICEKIISENLDIKWWCETRANIPPDLLDLMKMAGCVSIVIGAESGSPLVLSNLKKSVTIKQIETIVAKCAKLVINCTAYFMYSHPGETYKDALLTLKLIKKFKNEYNVSTAFQPTMILPGTQIEALAKEKRQLVDFRWSKDYFDSSNEQLDQISNIPLFYDKMPFQEMLKLHDKYGKIVYRSYLLESIKDTGMSAYLCYYAKRLSDEYMANGLKQTILKLRRNIGDMFREIKPFF